MNSISHNRVNNKGLQKKSGNLFKIPISTALGLGLHQEHLFGQAVGGVGFFGVAVPEVFLFDGGGEGAGYEGREQ